tara:strand:- start:283 stop:501 length:219 start_codon:yes stop_codon:yes gene_type:complete
VGKAGNKTLTDQLTPAQMRDLKEFAKLAKDDPSFVEAHGWEGIARFFRKKWKRKRLAAKTLRANVSKLNGKS